MEMRGSEVKKEKKKKPGLAQAGGVDSTNQPV